MKRMIIRSLLLGILLAVVHHPVLLGFELPDPISYFKQPFDFRLFNSLPVDNATLLRILKKYSPGFSEHKLVSQGYTYPLATLVGEVKLKKAGFLKINELGITYDQIERFVITRNGASGANYLEFFGKKSTKLESGFQFKIKNCYVINVEESFLKLHTVKVHPLSQAIDWTGPDHFLPRVAVYLRPRQKQGQLNFIGKKENAAALRKKLAEDFTYKLYQVKDLSQPKFRIASFTPKNTAAAGEGFTLLMINDRISYYGHFSDFVAFSIDGRCYLQCFNQVVSDSGYWGKLLYVFEGDKLKLVQEDYSYAD